MGLYEFQEVGGSVAPYKEAEKSRILGEGSTKTDPKLSPKP